jgi:hypothetical protein
MIGGLISVRRGWVDGRRGAVDHPSHHGERNITWELCRHQLMVQRVRFRGVGKARVRARATPVSHDVLVTLDAQKLDSAVARGARS